MPVVMHDPYVNIRRRTAKVLHWAVAIALTIFFGDALIAMRGFPYFSAVAVLIAVGLMLAAIAFARILRGPVHGSRGWIGWLLSMCGGLFFYAWVYQFTAFGLARIVLLFSVLMSILESFRAPVAETRGEMLFLVGSRLGMLLAFFWWQGLWPTIFIAPGTTIFVNLAATLAVIRHLGRAKSLIVCLLSSSAAAAMASLFTFALPTIGAMAFATSGQILVAGIALICGGIVGFALGAVSYSAAEPFRETPLMTQGSETSDSRNDSFESAGTSHPVESVGELLSLAGDPDNPDASGQVYESLLRLAPHAVAELTAALGNSNRAIREAAAYALREAGRDAAEAIPSLRAALQDEWPAVRQKAAVSLARLGASDAETVRALEAMASDSSLTVRLAAQKALRELKTIDSRLHDRAIRM